MSTESDKATISKEKAETEAEKILRFKIGSLPHLGSPEYEDGDYVFNVSIRLPRVIFDEERENPIDLRYLSSEEVGEIRINAESGELSERTDVWTINTKIKEKQREVDIAVQKALLKAEAEKFSLLPFPEHRYTPIQDLLAEVILQGQIPKERFDEIGSGAWEKYEEYVAALDEADLLRQTEDRITGADHLIEIEARTDYPSDALDAALAQFFREGADNYDLISQILGPYLTIAGHYYRRSLEVDELPRVSTRDFREQIHQRYSGRDGREKTFKLSRYLLQLEAIGLLSSESARDGRGWVGKSEILVEILQQEEALEPIAEIRP